MGAVWGMLAAWVLPAAGAVTVTNVAVPDAFVFPGALLVAQIIEIRVPTGQTLDLREITVKNTATGTKIAAGDLEYIEIRRGSETGTLLKKETTLAGFESAGVTIALTTNNRFTAGTHRLFILVKLKSLEALVGKALALGETSVKDTASTSYAVTYPPAAATFTVVGPKVDFQEIEDASEAVYRGQRFLAARILVDASEVPLDFTLSRLLVRNVASGSGVIPLAGRYLTRVEVRRALDGALLGEQTSRSELDKFATTGTAVTLTANNRVYAYSQVLLEVWLTLASDAPLGHKIQLGASVRLEGTDFAVGEPGKAPKFTVVHREDLGLETERLDLPDRGVVPGQTFLAQGIRLRDSDPDPYDVILGSVLVRNTASDPLADQHVARIEVKRRADGAVLGSATDLSGLSTTGVRIALTADNVIPDDTEVEIELYVTLRETAPLGRKLKLATQIWYTEGGASLATEVLKGPATFTVVGPAGLEVENRTPSPPDRNVFPGLTFLAQRLYLEDQDDDPYDVTITRVLVKNLSTGTVVGDAHVARIEVRDAAGRLLGETTSISGLTTTGVWVPTTANNVIPDDKNLTIEIWVTLKGDVPAGLKFMAGARVQHTEGGQTFTKPLDFLSSGVEFTTATGTPRTVTFTYSPDAPKWSDEITFTPSVSPATGVVYARWDFGDGRVVELKTAEGDRPLDPIKHTYRKGGEFTVVYAVRDDANREVRATRRVTVTNAPPRNVDFSFSPASPLVNQTITFTPAANIEDPDGDITKATFRWDFGDGGPTVTTTGPQPVTRAFAQAGTYTVTLTVTDEGGAAETAKRDVTVGTPTPPAPQPPTVTGVSLTPPNPEAGKPVVFTATTTAPANDPVSEWEWEFGDGTPATTTETNTATHTYTNPGAYTVRVRARNSAGWSVPYTRTITVFPAGVTFGFLILDNPVTGNQCRIQIFAPAGATDVKLTILDMAGRPVLLDKPVSVGTFTWDLKDREGRLVPNGLYLFYVTARIEGQIQRTEIGRILVRR